MRDKIVPERKPHLLCRKRLQEVHFGLRSVPKGGRAAGSSRGAHETFSPVQEAGLADPLHSYTFPISKTLPCAQKLVATSKC